MGAKKILGAGEMLRACGTSYEDGPLDRMFIVEIPALASRDEILRRMELKKILGIVPEKVVMKWDQGFEAVFEDLQPGDYSITMSSTDLAGNSEVKTSPDAQARIEAVAQKTPTTTPSATHTTPCDPADNNFAREIHRI